MLAESTVLRRRVLAGRRRLLGETHWHTLECEALLAMELAEQDQIAEAREIRDRLLPIVRRILGPAHRITGWLNDPDFLDPSRFE